MAELPLDQEDINNIITIEQRKKAVQQELQSIGISEFNIQLRKDAVKKTYQDNLSLQNQLSNYLQEKYGNGTIDIEKKVFIPTEEKK